MVACCLGFERIPQLVIGSGIAGSDNSSQERHHVIDGIKGSSPFWNTGTIRPESGWENSDCDPYCGD
ncbi:hypothetical protein Tco_0899446 [Tanacetum coccineum]